MSLVLNTPIGVHNTANDEWAFLVNETLEGEKCIIPLLREILRDSKISGKLKETIQLQLDEEVDHVRLFHGLVGKEKLPGSGYKEKLHTYVSNLDSITLKLFSLQAMLEGFALGALEYRLSYIDNSPSEKVDKRAYAEELEHVSFSYNHFKTLQNIEGVLTDEKFLKVTRDVNNILSQSFRGTVADKTSDGFSNNPNNPFNRADSKGMILFRKHTLANVFKNKNLFMKTYKAVIND